MGTIKAAVTNPAELAALKQIYQDCDPGSLKWSFPATGEINFQDKDGGVEVRDGIVTGLDLEETGLNDLSPLAGLKKQARIILNGKDMS